MAILVGLNSSANSASTTQNYPPSDYQYILFQQGPVTVTRRSLDHGGALKGTILFTDLAPTCIYSLHQRKLPLELRA